MSSPIFIVGCGYVGSRCARAIREKGNDVHVITRNATRIQDQGLADQIIEFDWQNPNPRWRISDHVAALVCCVSHYVEANASPERKNLHARGLQNVLKGFEHTPKRVIYLSTTGVYQAVDSGAWVDEESLCQPVRSGPQNALDAENWLAANLSASSVILRPAGIYGPGRIPNIDALRAGTPVAVDPSSYLNLIHVDDLVQVIDCIVEASNIPHTIYNVCDGAPVLRSEYYQYLANRINAPAPSFVPKVADRNIGIRTRGQGSKRIDTKRLNRDFSISWKYPNYQVGLGPLLDHVDNPK